MNIVIEGIDNTRKSTLASVLSSKLERVIFSSDGPPRYDGETNDRAEKFLSRRRVIFDRHPCVSGVIYGKVLRNDVNEVHHRWVSWFYNTAPLIIYCRPTLAQEAEILVGHVIKKADTESHIEALSKNVVPLLKAYDEWAHQNAHMTYRWGDNIERLTAMVRGAVNE